MSDYPSDETLKAIENWPYQDIAGALDRVAAEWWPDGEWGVSREVSEHEAAVLHADPSDHYLRLATGGWSGNEELIAALRTNLMVWSLSWRLTASGGLHIFQYPERQS